MASPSFHISNSACEKMSLVPSPLSSSSFSSSTPPIPIPIVPTKTFVQKVSKETTYNYGDDDERENDKKKVLEETEDSDDESENEKKKVLEETKDSDDKRENDKKKDSLEETKDSDNKRENDKKKVLGESEDSDIGDNDIVWIPPPITCLRDVKRGTIYSFVRYDEEAKTYVVDKVSIPRGSLYRASKQDSKLKLFLDSFHHDNDYGDDEEDEEDEEY